MQRRIATVAAAAVLATLVPGGAQAAALTDIRTHWARTAIEAGVAEGYINGFPDRTFRPDQPITRAEFFKLLAGALRLAPQPAQPSPFAERQHWSAQQGHLQAAVGGGLIFPPDYGTHLGPDSRIPRRELVLAAVRAVGKEGVVGSASLTVPDAASYPDWLQQWAAVAVGDGLLTGYGDGRLDLDRTATRAEALVLVQRILQRVTMNLVASDLAGSPNLIRHPAAGEPLWTVSGSEGKRPTFSDGTHSFTPSRELLGFWLLPAPVQAAWLGQVVADGDQSQLALGRLHQGRLTAVGTYDGPVTALAVDGGGRLWFSHGTDLLIAGRDGKVTSIPVGERLLLGDVDWQGTLWAAGAASLYRVTPGGQAEQVLTGLQGQARHLAVAEDGSVWLLRAGGDAARVEAVRLREGKEVQRVRLLSTYFGGQESPVQGAVLGRSGPFRWVIAQAGEGGNRQESLFRFDLESGAFVRLVAPRAAGAQPALVPAPDGGALLRDSAGKFWRVAP